MPVGAARLEATLQRAGQLDVAMTIVGIYESESTTAVQTTDLRGDCTQATQVIHALTVGAFEFYAGASVMGGAGAQILGTGAGAESAAARELLSRDGDAALCEKASAADQTPPFGCGALLRVEVVPVGGAGASDSGAPSENLLSSIRRAEAEEAERIAEDERRAARLQRGGSHLVLHTFFGGGIFAPKIDPGNEWEPSNRFNGMGPDLGAGLGVLLPLGTRGDFQSRVVGSWSKLGGEAADQKSGDARIDSELDRYTGGLDASFRLRPVSGTSRWYVGLGGFAGGFLASGSGKVVLDDAPTGATVDLSNRQTVFLGTFETGGMSGNPESLDVSARFSIGIDRRAYLFHLSFGWSVL